MISEYALLLFLSFNAAGGKSGHQMLFDAQKQDDYRDGGKQRRREQVLPLDEIVSVEGVDADGYRLEHVIGYKSQRDGIFVPGVYKNENQRGDDARRRHRQQDAGHGADSAAAVDLRGLLHLRRDGEERAPEEPDGKRLIERGVQQNKAHQVVCKVHVHHELVDADEQHHGGEHLAYNNSAQEKGFSLEAHAGHGIGRRHAAENGQRRGAARYNNGIGKVPENRGFAPQINKVRPLPYLGKHGHIGGVHLRSVLRRGDEGDKIGIQRHNADHKYENIQRRCGARLAFFHDSLPSAFSVMTM